ncbi:MAG: 50S ribosomal protein L29 [Acidimicrobiales bacterium]
MVTAATIAGYDTEELERQLSETRRELFNLRFQMATGQLDNFSRLNHVRKDVARMLTELRMREIAEAEGLELAEIPAHRAADRRRQDDEAHGRDSSTASERRAAARAQEEAEENALAGEGIRTEEDARAEEKADDDGMANAPVEDAFASEDPSGDSDDDQEES